MSLADWLYFTGAWVENDTDVLDTNSTHKGIAYAHLTSPAPYTSDYITYNGYVCHVGHAVSSRN